MPRNTSISLGAHFDSFIENEVSSGRYSSRSEVIRSALRLLEEKENKIQSLRNALIEGEKSGFVEDFDPNTFLAKVRSKYL